MIAKRKITFWQRQIETIISKTNWNTIILIAIGSVGSFFGINVMSNQQEVKEKVETIDSSNIRRAMWQRRSDFKDSVQNHKLDSIIKLVSKKKIK